MAQTSKFRLRVEGPNDKNEIVEIKIVEIPIGTLTIGRGADNILQLDNGRVSNHHAEIDFDGAEFWLTDVGSTNGTKVNDIKLKAHDKSILSSPEDDIIEIGPYRLTFSQVAESTQEMKSNPIKEEAISTESTGGAFGKPLANDALPVPLPPSPSFDLPGLSLYGCRLLSYLPELFHPPDPMADCPGQPPTEANFFARFLGIFENILTPLEWNIDNFDLYLNPLTAPSDFLPWLAGWYGLTFEPTWEEADQRKFLQKAHWLFEWRGTRKALSRVLEIYTGVVPEIEEPEEKAHTFNVTIHLPPGKTVDRETWETVERLIETHKPAHTVYNLEILSNPHS
jgi:phage tail-like protein